MLLQQDHGLFPRVVGKGDNAKRLVNLLIRMRSEATAGGPDSISNLAIGSKPSTTIDEVIVIDRDIDAATPLLTQLTYEGLIDEIFTISNNHVEAPTSIVGAAQPAQLQQSSATQSSQSNIARPPSAPLKRKIPLDSNDKLFAQLRDTNFALVGSLLNKVARRLQSEYDTQRTSGSSKTTAELRDFVAKLPGYQAEQASLKTHTNLAEEIMRQTREDLWAKVLEVQQNLVAGADPSSLHDTIEELINRAAPLTTILRLLCLESVITTGFRQKELDYFKRLVIHAYGHQHLLTLSRLEKMGLLCTRTGSAFPSIPTSLPTSTPSLSSNSTPATQAGASQTNYATLRRTLRLVVDDVSESSPTDIAYAYSGYAPLSIRILQTVLQKRYLAELTRASAGVLQQAKTAEEPVGAGGVQVPGAGKLGFRPYEEVLRSVKGPVVEIAQGHEGEQGRERERARAVLKGGDVGSKGKDGDGKEAGKVTLVVFVGGVCYAEVAACRFVSAELEKEGRGRRVVVCTTGMISGDRMIGGAVEERSFGGKERST
jgi:vacuolar protein sorting-associated protein 33A